jgi:hypothetical protein
VVSVIVILTCALFLPVPTGIRHGHGQPVAAEDQK